MGVVAGGCPPANGPNKGRPSRARRRSSSSYSSSSDAGICWVISPLDHIDPVELYAPLLKDPCTVCDDPLIDGGICSSTAFTAGGPLMLVGISLPVITARQL